VLARARPQVREPTPVVFAQTIRVGVFPLEQAMAPRADMTPEERPGRDLAAVKLLAELHGGTDEREGLDVFDCAERVTTFTLVCSAAQLREQLHRGEIAPRTFFGRHVGPRRHRLLEREYADPDRMREHYRRWFDHLRTRPGEHRVVSLDGGTGVRPIAEWESALDDAAGAAREPRR
jgi:hypothetical protein